MLAHAVRHYEELRGIEAEELFRQLHFIIAERLAMCLRRVLSMRCAVADMAMHDDQRRPIIGAQEIAIGLLDQ